MKNKRVLRNANGKSIPSEFYDTLPLVLKKTLLKLHKANAVPHLADVLRYTRLIFMGFFQTQQLKIIFSNLKNPIEISGTYTVSQLPIANMTHSVEKPLLSYKIHKKEGKEVELPPP